MDNPFIGQLNRKIEIILISKVKTTAGGVVETETIISNPYAFMKEVSGKEDPEGKIRHIINRTYSIRYNSQVLEKSTELKIKDGDVMYNVFHVKEIGRKKHLEILVTKYD